MPSGGKHYIPISSVQHCVLALCQALCTVLLHMHMYAGGTESHARPRGPTGAHQHSKAQGLQLWTRLDGSRPLCALAFCLVYLHRAASRHALVATLQLVRLSLRAIDD
jgi:hypothetical protein